MLWSKKTNDQRRVKPDTTLLKANKQAVHSYYNKIPTPSQPAALSEKIINLADSQTHVRRVPTIILLVVIALSFLFSLTLSRTPSVITADKEVASPYRETQEYSNAAKEILGQKLAYRTKLTVNTHEVEEALLAKFPELDAAVLRLPVLGRKPNLVLAISQPAMLLATQTKSYIIDDDGVAVSEASGISDAARQKLIVLRDESGLPIELGKQIVTSDTIAFIAAVKAQFKAQNLEISQLTLPPNANQLNIKLKGVSYIVKTDVAGDARVQIGSFMAVREYTEKQGIVLKEYIDVRVEEKVFYK